MTDNCFFAASNGGLGFYSRFGEIFNTDLFDTIYIIKGGPGTGKSTFMKKIGAEAEKHGYNPFYYFCSSDPHSLDGVVIKELGIAVLDGTAPHVTEAKFPGACERILNFGDAFDTASLRARREVIERLSAQNSEQYKRAYSLLGASREFMLEELRISKSIYKSEKAKSFARRFVSGMSRGTVSSSSICTVCGEGVLRMPVYEHSAEKIFAVDDFGGMGHLLLSDIADIAKTSGISAALSTDPISSEYPESIYFEKDRVYIAIDRGDVGTQITEGSVLKKLNVQRFVDSEKLRSERKYLRMLHKKRTETVAAAVSEMKKAKEIHDKLEAIYIAFTDFERIDELFERVKINIFEN